MTTSPATVTAARYVGLQYGPLNLGVFKVTPLEDGLQLVEYLQMDAVNTGEGAHPERAEALRLIDQARIMAVATGSTGATHIEDRRELDGTLTVTGQATYFRNGHAVARDFALGVHKASVALDADQIVLREELNAQRAADRKSLPKVGDRRIVSELTGYELVQNRNLDHRSCHCGDGTTTYLEGTVARVTHWADNSIEADVIVEGGRRITETLVAPHGDACF